jgi:DNA primase
VKTPPAYALRGEYGAPEAFTWPCRLTMPWGARRGTGNALRTECSFLKHTEGWHRWAAPSIRRIQIQEQKKVGEYLAADSKEALVGLVQGDIVEVHCWNLRADHVEKPDQIVFDLDPGPTSRGRTS